MAGGWILASTVTAEDGSPTLQRLKDEIFNKYRLPIVGVKEEIQTEEAPEPIGPYSQGIRDGNRVYISGQGPADPETREILVEGIRDQTAQVLENASAVLEASGTSLEHVVRATVYLADMDDYDAMNDVYREHIPQPYPARVAMEMAELPGPFSIEISMIARIPTDD